MFGIILGDDEKVAAWAYSTFKRIPVKIERALGIVDNKNGSLVGAIIFSNYNGCNIEMSYYGPWTLTAGITRLISKFLLNEFNVSRLSVLTSKKNRRLMRSLQKFGFKLEGVQRCHYGVRDCNKNTAVRFVAFRHQLAKVAGIPQVETQEQQG